MWTAARDHGSTFGLPANSAHSAALVAESSQNNLLKSQKKHSGGVNLHPLGEIAKTQGPGCLFRGEEETGSLFLFGETRLQSAKVAVNSSLGSTQSTQYQLIFGSILEAWNPILKYAGSKSTAPLLNPPLGPFSNG